MKEHIDGAALSGMLLCAANALNKNKQLINDLNVFPVPDGDTGTNMSLTIGASATELRKDGTGSVGIVAERIASAMLRGARGNSGVILSLLFRGISKTLRGAEEADAKLMALAMSEGVDAAYKAVMKPAEGTILTVSRMATRAALDFADHSSDIGEMFAYAIAAAELSLAETQEINPVLKKAGVVDAGAKGYVIILEAMLAFLEGQATPDIEEQAAPQATANFSAFATEDITFTYCTEFIVDKTADKDVAIMRAFLDGIGDSLVVVDDETIIKVHVHTNEPGSVLTEALTYGVLISVKVENMREQHTHLENPVYQETPATPVETWTLAKGAADDAPPKKYGVVTIAAGDGMKNLFIDLGADCVVNGGQTMNPCTEDILQEIERINADTIYILPNNKNIIMAAEQCIPLTDKQVVVIPSATVPQGVAAMLALDEELDVAECTQALNDAIGHIHTVLVTYAARDSDFDGRDIREGEYLALLENALIGSYIQTDELIAAVCSSFEGFAPEFITVYYGQGVARGDAESTAALVSEYFENAEVTVINGGQPVYYYMISAE